MEMVMRAEIANYIIIRRRMYMIYYEILEDGSIGQCTDDIGLAKILKFYNENNVADNWEDFIWYNGKKQLKTKIDYDNYLQQEKVKELRKLREPLLIAFDKYKSNVNYGIEVESDEQRAKIIEWYNAIKDLDENCIVKEENIPERIQYYL
jgi:hypothetical protein